MADDTVHFLPKGRLMWRFICLLLLSFAMIGVSSFSDAAEPSSKDEKRITSWLVEVADPKTGEIKGEMLFSIFDADTDTPALVEFLYNVGKHTDYKYIDYNISNIESFTVISSKPTVFQIQFKVSPAYFDFAGNIASDFTNLASYLPTSLIINMRNKSDVLLNPISSLHSTAPSRKLKVALRSEHKLKDFRPRASIEGYRVFKADDIKPIKYHQYFPHRGLELPQFNIVNQAAIPEVKVAKEKRITRWTSNFTNPITKQTGLITISVLDAETKPVLIELAYTIGEGWRQSIITTSDIQSFNVIPPKEGGGFLIQFKKEHFMEARKKNLSIYHRPFVPFLPEAVYFNLDPEDKYIHFKSSEDLNGDDYARVASKKIEQLHISDYKPLLPNLKAWVFEPSAKDPFDYQSYFDSKGILLPNISETAAKSRKITRWTVDVMDGSTYLGEISVAISDAETDPMLIAAKYSVGGLVYDIEDVETFAPSGKVKGSFDRYRIQFKKNKNFTFAATVLHFDLKDSGMMVHSLMRPEGLLKISTVIAGKKEVMTADLFYKNMKNTKAAPVAKALKPLDDKRITRWTAPIIHPETGKEKGKIELSVFDAETNPVLVEAFYDYSNIVRHFSRVEKFELIKDQPGHFQVTFDVPGEYYHNGKINPLNPNIPYVPVSVNFDTKDKNPILTLEMISDLDGSKRDIRELKAKIEKIAPQHFKLTEGNATAKVREPSTIHALSFKDYFGPKGIDLPHFFSSSIRSTPQQQSYSYSISSADDIKLGSLLKDKTAEVWELLQSKDKPTMKEFLKAIGVQPKKGEANPLKNYSRNPDLKFELENDLPKVIAQFEKAFPGAIWYGLGRDIYLFSDALDAYYISIGQNDRVKRLHASQPSFNEDNPGEVIDFLKTNGFEFKNINKDSTPHIIFDVTSYSKKSADDFKINRFSQSAQLMRAAYLEWQNLGREPHELLPKVNFVSVSRGANNHMIEADSNIESFFKNMDFDPPAPSRILRVDGPRSLQYATSWHGIYERFKRTKNNQVIAPFREIKDYNDKLAMLAELWDVAAIVMDKGFTKKTATLIKKYKETAPKAEKPPEEKKKKKTKAAPKTTQNYCDEALDDLLKKYIKEGKLN